jgi:hypothetical protein
MIALLAMAICQTLVTQFLAFLVKENLRVSDLLILTKQAFIKRLDFLVLVLCVALFRSTAGFVVPVA